jgi:hypothetical protein
VSTKDSWSNQDSISGDSVCNSNVSNGRIWDVGSSDNPVQPRSLGLLRLCGLEFCHARLYCCEGSYRRDILLNLGSRDKAKGRVLSPVLHNRYTSGMRSDRQVYRDFNFRSPSLVRISNPIQTLTSEAGFELENPTAFFVAF